MTVAAESQGLPVLLVDDEPQLLHSVSIGLRSAGLAQVISCEDSRRVLPLLARQAIAVVVLDLTMPHLSGQTLLKEISADYPEIPVIVMTATSELDTAVQCMRDGATDYLVKPVEMSRLVATINRCFEVRQLREEVVSLKQSLLTSPPRHNPAFSAIVTQNKAVTSIFRYLEAVSASPQPVLITGESGTGKELIAQAIHAVSGRSGQFVSINVAGLDDTMFSDTLFGHARGAYTGADKARDGLVASAAQGTLFLDEIGDLPIRSQVKLLRLLQDGSFYPLGSDQHRKSQARIVVATNCDVLREVREGRFRRDLYHRLHTHHVELPPLRARLSDLQLLVAHFLEKAATMLDKPTPTAAPALFQLLRTYDFPGNVRELEGMCFDAVARHPGGVLSLQSFREVIANSRSSEAVASAPTEDSASDWLPEHLPTLKEAEQALIDEALRRAGGNQGIAAGILGLSRQALNRRLVLQRQPERDAFDP